MWKKIRGASADQLDDALARRPPISDVSERTRRMKEAEIVRCPDVTMNPITWQVEHATENLEEFSFENYLHVLHF